MKNIYELSGTVKSDVYVLNDFIGTADVANGDNLQESRDDYRMIHYLTAGTPLHPDNVYTTAGRSVVISCYDISKRIYGCAIETLIERVIIGTSVLCIHVDVGLNSSRISVVR